MVNYTTQMLQQQQPSENQFKGLASNEKHMPILESSKEEPGWPSFGQLIIDLSKLSLEALASAFIPSHFRPGNSKRGLKPLNDRLVMPEDDVRPPLVNRQNAQGHTPLTENRMASQVHTPTTVEKYSEMKPPKIKSSSFKDPSMSSKHRSSKLPEYAEFYGLLRFLHTPNLRARKKGQDTGNEKRVEKLLWGQLELRPNLLRQGLLIITTKIYIPKPKEK